MNIVKCPNPSCPFQFDASLVPAGATIACPQCRLQFQLPAAPTGFTPPPPPPPAEPEPLAPDITDEDTAPRRPLRKRRDDEPENDKPVRKRGRDRDDAEGDAPPPAKKGNTAALLALVAVGLAVLLGGAVVGLGFMFGWFGGKKPGGGESGEFRYNEYALTLNGPGDGWSKDDGVKKSLNVRLAAFKRSDPEGYVAVHAERTEGPASKGELMPKAVKILRDAFDDVEDQLTPVDATLLGEKGQKYEFSGRYKGSNGIGCQGEVYAVAVRDLQVWVFTWGDRDHFKEQEAAFNTFRAAMKLDPPKPGATVKIPEKPYRTPSGLYVITDKDDQWKKQSDPTIQEDKADLFLKGTPKGGKGSGAELVVAVLDAGADAKAHVIAQFDDANHKSDQSPVESEPEGDDAPCGKVAASADVVRVKLTYPGTDKSADKFVVYKVVDSGGKRVVAYASCTLKAGGYWEQRMMGIVGSLKALK